MKSTYDKNDVIILLKDITGLVEPKPSEIREKLIQSGTHYCEMLPIEYKPSKDYMLAYKKALNNFSDLVANAAGCLSDKIIDKKGKNITLVSLARAGTPIGILIKRYIKFKYKIDITHYTLSIIRGRGIDKNAVKYILERHKPEDILFLDGWIGKGAILNELKLSVKSFKGLSKELAVLADPAYVTEFCGTNEDILIPSSCLNASVCGLISRTFLRDDIIKENDFHGAIYYENLKENDLSYEFINTIEKKFKKENIFLNKKFVRKGIDEVMEIANKFNINDINLIKPGLGETTRALLRRIPEKILINYKNKNDLEINHILELADRKSVV